MPRHAFGSLSNMLVTMYVCMYALVNEESFSFRLKFRGSCATALTYAVYIRIYPSREYPIQFAGDNDDVGGADGGREGTSSLHDKRSV